MKNKEKSKNGEKDGKIHCCFSPEKAAKTTTIWRKKWNEPKKFGDKNLSQK